jgi:hypothetical protein
MSIQLKSKIDSSQPYHIYYDINMINNDVSEEQKPSPVIFNESRTNPYIASPENYFASIIRFSLQTPSLPVFIPMIEIGQNDVNKTIYKVLMEYQGVRYEQTVMYIPSDLSLVPPIIPLVAQDVSSKYYFVYSIQQWIEMVNKALSDCFDQIPTPPPASTFPRFVFNVDTSLLELYTDTNWEEEIISPINLYMNNSLFTLFDSFPRTREQINGTGPFYNKFKIVSNAFTNINIGAYRIVSKQETTTIGLLNPVKSIVFKAGMLPIANELLAPPKFFGVDSTLFSNGNNSNISPILTDFQVAVSNLNTYKETIEYVPSGEYRLIDMFGNSPLGSLELSVFWQDNFGGLHILELQSGCSCTIKIMFRRKDFNAVDIGF